MMRFLPRLALAVTMLAMLSLAGCLTRPGTPAKRKGDEIIVGIPQDGVAHHNRFATAEGD